MSHPFTQWPQPSVFGVTSVAGGAIECRHAYQDKHIVVGHYPSHAGTGMPYRVKLIDRANLRPLAKMKLSREGLMHLRDAVNELLVLNIEDED